jgi:hypothetical protein
MTENNSDLEIKWIEPFIKNPPKNTPILCISTGFYNVREDTGMVMGIFVSTNTTFTKKSCTFNGHNCYTLQNGEKFNLSPRLWNNNRVELWTHLDPQIRDTRTIYKTEETKQTMITFYKKSN